MAQFTTYLKNIFFFLIFLQIIPVLIMGIKRQYSTLLEPKSQVAVIPIKGTLNESGYYIKHLREFFKNQDIKAIVLAMDCPGGKAGTSQAIYEEIKALKTQHVKPVVALVENVCASGGYYIACAADTIVSTPSAFVGSIGVYISQPQLKEFIEQFKIKYGVIKTGDYKTAGDPLLEQTPEQKTMLQGLTNDTYTQFVQDVAKSRPQLALAQANEWANGQIFTGRQGLEKGLIDEIGSFSVLEKTLRQKTTLEEKIDWVYPPKPSPFRGLFGTNDEDYPDGDSYIGWFINGVKSYISQDSVAIKT